ncbi:MAG: response regulator [Anaerolineae bacterium]|nr:response regulator [Anaerolineae bacterium]
MTQKILVVEDDLVLRETLAYNLTKEGYTVLTAGDGTSVIEITRHKKPDLVMLDIMLPGIDGFEVCRTVRRDRLVRG